jgi:hypothetical protein
MVSKEMAEKFVEAARRVQDYYEQLHREPVPFAAIDGD